MTPGPWPAQGERPAAAEGAPRRVLVVDNQDSFAWLLHGYLEELGAQPRHTRGSDVRLPLAGVDAVLLASALSSPQAAGDSPQAAGDHHIVAHCAEVGIPLLGVGPGHQSVATAFGATVARAGEPMHGKTMAIDHDATGLFTNLPTPLTVACYHSFVVDDSSVRSDLRVTARSPDGVVMAVAHRRLPVHGVQFHPEAVVTEHGYQLLGNWLAMAGDASAAARGARLAPRLTP